jgi:hypothetical protein
MDSLEQNKAQLTVEALPIPVLEPELAANPQ